MAVNYVRKIWQNFSSGGTPITAPELNRIETGVNDVVTAVNLAAPAASPTLTGTVTFTGTVSGLTKSMVGLGNVDNTADASKPVSTAQQAALDGKAAAAHTHAQADVNGLTAALTARMVIVSYGTTTTTARPSGVPNGGVYWIGTGTATPSNALPADLIFLP